MIRAWGWGFLVLAGALAAARAGEGEADLSREIEGLKARLARLEGGERPAAGENWFERIEVGIEATGIVQGSSGAEPPHAPKGDETDATTSLELTASARLNDRDTALVWLTAGSGEGLDGAIPTLSGFNADADNDENVRLYELWYEHRFWEDRAALRVGRVDLVNPCGCNESGFDANAVANDECAQFLSPGFVNSLAIELPDGSGAGAMLWLAPHPLLDVGAAVADADVDWDEVFDNVFAILEADLKPTFRGRAGNYRVYVWINDTDHEEIADPAEDDEEGYGVGLSFDQEVSEHVTAFLRYGWQREEVYAVEHAWSFGAEVSGAVVGREDDYFGLAYGAAALGKDWEDAAEAAGGDPADEHHFELYYNATVNENLSVSMDVQWVGDPDGDDGNDDVWALGVRAQVAF